MTELDAIRERFPEHVPVFPLPGTVLFPGAILPLHVFEPRYRSMVEDALAGPRLIAMGLLAQCTQEEYKDHPPFHDTVCVGTLIQHESMSDGRSNILLLGVAAAQAKPVDLGKPYQTATIEALPDLQDLGPEEDDLMERAFAYAAPGSDSVDSLRRDLGGLMEPHNVGSGVVSACAITAAIPPLSKLALLEERSVRRRLEQLVTYLERPWQWN
ncbi:MAG: LON peptidase substrate-binding domain-containing protein [Planctomycetota bacterium]